MTIHSLIDLTLLNSQATASDIKALTKQGLQYQVAALCVFPQHLEFIPTKAHIARATVANFPSGNEPHADVLDSIKKAITHHQADEIDYVFPYQTYLAGNKEQALSYCHQAYQQTKQYGKLFKVILETGALPSEDVIYQLSLDVLHSGCDFLKTSTGKIAIGATIPAATAMLHAIKDAKMASVNVPSDSTEPRPLGSGAPLANAKVTWGIKLSGGIRTSEQAEQYMKLAEQIIGASVNKHWFRLGVSRLPQITMKKIYSFDIQNK